MPSPQDVPSTLPGFFDIFENETTKPRQNWPYVYRCCYAFIEANPHISRHQIKAYLDQRYQTQKQRALFLENWKEAFGISTIEGIFDNIVSYHEKQKDELRKMVNLFVDTLKENLDNPKMRKEASHYYLEQMKFFFENLPYQYKEEGNHHLINDLGEEDRSFLIEAFHVTDINSVYSTMQCDHFEIQIKLEKYTERFLHQLAEVHRLNPNDIELKFQLYFAYELDISLCTSFKMGNLNEEIATLYQTALKKFQAEQMANQHDDFEYVRQAAHHLGDLEAVLNEDTADCKDQTVNKVFIKANTLTHYLYQLAAIIQTLTMKVDFVNFFGNSSATKGNTQEFQHLHPDYVATLRQLSEQLCYAAMVTSQKSILKKNLKNDPVMGLSFTPPAPQRPIERKQSFFDKVPLLRSKPPEGRSRASSHDSSPTAHRRSGSTVSSDSTLSLENMGYTDLHQSTQPAKEVIFNALNKPNITPDELVKAFDTAAKGIIGYGALKCGFRSLRKQTLLVDAFLEAVVEEAAEDNYALQKLYFTTNASAYHSVLNEVENVDYIHTRHAIKRFAELTHQQYQMHKEFNKTSLRMHTQQVLPEPLPIFGNTRDIEKLVELHNTLKDLKRVMNEPAKNHMATIGFGPTNFLCWENVFTWCPNGVKRLRVILDDLPHKLQADNYEMIECLGNEVRAVLAEKQFALSRRNDALAEEYRSFFQRLNNVSEMDSKEHFRMKPYYA